MPATKDIHVLHTIPALFSKDGGIVGGAERYAFELAKNMALRVPTTLLTFGPTYDEFTDGHLRVRVIGNPHYVRGQRSNPFSLIPLLKELQSASVVHCHQQHIITSSISAAFSRLTGRRVFVTDLGGGGWDVSSYISTDRWYHGHLHISQYSRKYFGHANQEWATTIYGGVDTSRFSPAATPGPREKIVFTGRLMPHKGVNDLVEALPPDLALTIIGQPYDTRFVELLTGLARGKAVSFCGDVSDQDLVEHYRSALCVVLPSVYRPIYGGETKVPELLGQTLLEGMACGAPAICTDVASMPEIVRDGVDGFIVPPNDPVSLRERLTWLAHNPEAVVSMGVSARRRVLDHFVWPRVVDKCLRFYDSPRDDVHSS